METKNIDFDLLTQQLINHHATGLLLSYNSDSLTSRQVREMLTDPQIIAALNIIKLPMIQNSWDVDCEDDNIREFVKETLNPLWTRLLTNALTALEYGFSAQEKVFEEKDGYIVLDKLILAKPWLVTLSLTDDGSFNGFVYGATVDIPPEKAFWWTYNFRYGNYYGQSILKSAHEIWRVKKLIMLFANRHYERRGTPPIIVKYPTQPQVTGNDKLSPNLEAQNILKIVESSPVVAVPRQIRGDKTIDLWEIESLAQDLKGDQFINYIDYLDRLILRSMFIPDKIIYGDEGSYSLSQTHSNLFMRFLQGIYNSLIEWINNYIVNQLVELNFGQDAPQARIIGAPLAQVEKDLLEKTWEILVQTGQAVVAYDNLAEKLGISDIVPESGDSEKLEKRKVPYIRLEKSDVKNKIRKKARARIKEDYRQLDKFYRKQASIFAWRKAYKPLAEYIKKFTRQNGYKEVPNELPDNIKSAISNYWSQMNTLIYLVGSAKVNMRASKVVKRKLQSYEEIDVLIDMAFDLPPEAAIEKFKGLVPMDKEKFEQLINAGKMHGFTVAGYDEAYALKMWQRAVEKAMSEGWTIREFQKYVEKELFVKAGLAPTNPFHIETVMRTNLQQAYMAGRWDALSDPFVSDVFPYLQYIAVMDANTRPSHAAMDGFTAPRDDPEWDTWYPPNGYNCRCDVFEIDKWEAKGITPDSPRGVMPDPGFEFNAAANWINI